MRVSICRPPLCTGERIAARGRARHGTPVPVWLESGPGRGTNVPAGTDEDGEEDGPADPVPAHPRRGAARVGGSGPRAGAGQGRELAHPPRVRVGEPRLAALDPLLRGE